MADLEFCLDPDDAARVLRLPVLARRTGRPAAVDRVWHDTADGALDADGISLCRQKGRWRLERSRPMPGVPWPPGTPPPVLGDADALEDFEHPLPGPLMPLAGLRGRQRTVRLDDDAPAGIVLLEGVLRGVTQDRPVCRLLLSGPAPRLLAMSSAIAAAVALTAPRWSLAAEAIALARGQPPAPRQTGTPAIPPGTRLADAVALVLGHLTDVILAGAVTAAAGRSPEPVHQMRVAVRRLRSALSIFRQVMECPALEPALEAVKPGLKQLATTLGAARDWDVFLEGTGRLVGDALPEDGRIAAMLEAGTKRRTAAYGALGRYLAGEEFRALEVALVQVAALRPWQDASTADQATQLEAVADGYATHLLRKRLKHMLAPGADIAALPMEELHAIRKQGKRLRYAAEFFTPLYGKRGARRFIGRLSNLQEALGHLNDTAAAAALTGTLGHGADRQFAAGAVQGFVAARQGGTRQDVAHAWSKFRREEPFWD